MGSCCSNQRKANIQYIDSEALTKALDHQKLSQTSQLLSKSPIFQRSLVFRTIPIYKPLVFPTASHIRIESCPIFRISRFPEIYRSEDRFSRQMKRDRLIGILEDSLKAADSRIYKSKNLIRNYKNDKRNKKKQNNIEEIIEEDHNIQEEEISRKNKFMEEKTDLNEVADQNINDNLVAGKGIKSNRKNQSFNENINNINENQIFHSSDEQNEEIINDKLKNFKHSTHENEFDSNIGENHHKTDENPYNFNKKELANPNYQHSTENSYFTENHQKIAEIHHFINENQHFVNINENEHFLDSQNQKFSYHNQYINNNSRNCNNKNQETHNMINKNIQNQFYYNENPYIPDQSTIKNTKIEENHQKKKQNLSFSLNESQKDAIHISLEKEINRRTPLKDNSYKKYTKQIKEKGVDFKEIQELHLKALEKEKITSRKTPSKLNKSFENTKITPSKTTATKTQRKNLNNSLHKTTNKLISETKTTPYQSHIKTLHLSINEFLKDSNVSTKSGGFSQSQAKNKLTPERKKPAFQDIQLLFSQEKELKSLQELNKIKVFASKNQSFYQKLMKNDDPPAQIHKKALKSSEKKSYLDEVYDFRINDRVYDEISHENLSNYKEDHDLMRNSHESKEFSNYDIHGLDKIYYNKHIFCPYAICEKNNRNQGFSVYDIILNNLKSFKNKPQIKKK